MECANSSGEVIVHFDSFGIWTMFPDDEVPQLRYVAKDSRPDWPKELHEQYMKILDERDKAIERAEQSEELLRYLRELLFQD